MVLGRKDWHAKSDDDPLDFHEIFGSTGDGCSSCFVCDSNEKTTCWKIASTPFFCLLEHFAML
jgi:hypothetical protein